MIVKKKILKRLHKIIMEIATSDDKTLDEMGKQLLDIIKKKKNVLWEEIVMI